MASLFLDENVAGGFSRELRHLGHTVTTVAEEGLAGASDPRILLAAAERRAALITHNRRDFRLLHDAWCRWSVAWGSARSHNGILILEQVRGLSAARLALVIDALLIDSALVLLNTCHDWRVHSGWRQVIR